MNINSKRTLKNVEDNRIENHRLQLKRKNKILCCDSWTLHPEV